MTKRNLYRAKFGVKVACLLAILCRAVPGEEVTIYRDGWGVPHVYGDTDRAVAFGYGYAQAEDRGAALLRNYAEAAGRLARTKGESAVAGDFGQRLWRHDAVARREWDRTPPEVREWVSGFAAGVNHVLRSRDTGAVAVHPTDVLALTRSLYWRGILEQLRQEHTGASSPYPGTLWGLAPEHTLEDATVLIADPSESWAPGRRWYEAHLHGRTIHAWGFTWPGVPLPVFGHNRHLGWGWRSGGPDTGDVYRIAFESEASSRYTWAGRRHTVRNDTVRIGVAGGADRVLVRQTSHLGPVITREGAIGFAYRVPDTIGAGQVAQLHGMVTARDFPAFYDALRPGRLGPATIVYGDTDGTLFYIRTGSVPIRPESVDWDRPVRTDVASDWLGTHVQEDLTQLLDPRPGRVVDALTSPDLVTPYSPLTPDRYPPYIFNHAPGAESDRSRRLRALVASTPRMTLDEIVRTVFDAYVIDSHLWLRALVLAVRAGDPEFSDDERRAYDILASWDGRARPDRLGPALYRDWRSACEAEGTDIDARSVGIPSGMTDRTRRSLIAAFRKAVAAHVERYGNIEIRWREIHRLAAHDRSWAVSGIEGPHAQSLRHIRTTPEGAIERAVGGQSAPTVMVFDPRGIRARSAVPFGQSDRPGSPHAWDQGEALFTRSRLKPARFDTRPPDMKKKKVIRLTDDLLAFPE